MVLENLRTRWAQILGGAIALFVTWIAPCQSTLAVPHWSHQGHLARQGSHYVLTLDNLHFEVDPSNGAKVVAFQLDDQNMLTPPSAHPLNYGSTFWPSPQHHWQWPPIAEIDSDPYTVQVNDLALLTQSEMTPMLGVQITKKFAIDPDRGGIAIEYIITNRSDQVQAFAPWEISRVHPDGLTFYPTGEAKLGSGPFDELATQDINGITWFKYDRQAIRTNQKLYADGAEGWLAHVYGDKLLVKSFQDVPLEHQAPREGEIEIFANASSPYVELEQQGPYAQIRPQESLSWTVHWFLRQLPSNWVAQVGDRKLVELVRQIVTPQPQATTTVATASRQ